MSNEQGENLGHNLGDRGLDGRFQPGNRASFGNRGGGRPKDELRQRMRDRSLDAERVLSEALQAVDADGNIDWRTRLNAASLILERAWGKAEQRVDLTGEDGGSALVLLSNSRLPDPEAPDES